MEDLVEFIYKPSEEKFRYEVCGNYICAMHRRTGSDYNFQLKEGRWFDMKYVSSAAYLLANSRKTSNELNITIPNAAEKFQEFIDYKNKK